jgi:BCD family chlorophyll transporter-like MFS transporter
MTSLTRRVVNEWIALGPRFLPFADAATPELPLARLLRLSLFQVSVGMATVLLAGTLNRVMILEMGVPTWLVSVMVSLPLLAAPFRALVGHRSDEHKSAFGWRRVPYVWYGSVLQWAGLAIMPFALLVMTDAPEAPAWLGPGAAGLAFLLVGAGLHTTQTAGMALANDLAPPHARPRVVALLYVMFLVGMLASGLVFGWLLAEFSPKRLIQVIQGAAVVTMVLNVVAMWKQEARVPRAEQKNEPREAFATAWAKFKADPRALRLLVGVGLGTFAFSMQDILLEPYGGEILHLTVGETTTLTAMLAAGALAGLAVSERVLNRGGDPVRLAGSGIVLGVFAFAAVILAAPMESPLMFRIGSALIGFGGGLFAVGKLVAAMELADVTDSGLAIGAWGAAQATAAGLGLALGGALRDILGHAAMTGRFGETLVSPATGYTFVYGLEILMLFAALVAIGPLVRYRQLATAQGRARPAFGLAELPG